MDRESRGESNGRDFFAHKVVDAVVPKELVDGFRTSIQSIWKGVEEQRLADTKLDLLRLRQSNRAMSQLVRSCKQRVQQTKSALDNVELSRQCLLYQKNHLQATIEDVQRHDSIYLSIPLPSNEDSNLMDLDLDEHGTMLHRLKTELEQRKQLSEQCKSKQESLELAKGRLLLKKKELEKVRDQLDSIIKTSEPLLNSHSRILADLIKREQEQEAAQSAPLPTKNHVNPLGLLHEQLCKYSENDTLVTVQYLDEIEPGEEFSDVEDSEGIYTPTADGTARFYHRFGASENVQNRKYSFAHILLKLKDESGMSLADLFFFLIADGSLAVTLIEPASYELLKAEQESFLLSLPLDPALLLTVSHESIVPGESGFVPFRWLQALTKLTNSESFGEPQVIISNFVASIRQRLSQFTSQSDSMLDNVQQ